MLAMLHSSAQQLFDKCFERACIGAMAEDSQIYQVYLTKSRGLASAKSYHVLVEAKAH